MGFPSPSEKQARILWVSLTALSIGVLLGLIGLLLWGLGWVINVLSPVLLPLAVAGVLAYLFDPLVDYFVKKRFERRWAIITVFMVVLLFVLALLATVVPQLIFQTNDLLDRLPGYAETFEEKVQELSERAPSRFRSLLPWAKEEAVTNAPAAQATEPGREAGVPSAKVETNAPAAEGEADAAAVPEQSESEEGVAEQPAAPAGGTVGPEAKQPLWESSLGERVIQWTSSFLMGVGRWALDQLKRVAAWAGLLIGLALVPVYTFYFLLEKRGIERGWTDYLPLRESRAKEEVVFVLRAINDHLIAFFRGQVLVALCVGLLLAIGFSIVGLNYALLLGVIAGIFGIVPYLGVMISLIPALLLAVIQFGDWWHPVLVLVIFGLVQMAEGLYLSPKIIGDKVGLHPLTVIIAVMIGTTLLGGILGGVLAIPLTAALRVMMFRYIWKKKGATSEEGKGPAPATA